MELNYERLRELVVDLIMSIDDNCYEHSEKLNIIKGSRITEYELKLLGFDYINDWFEDAESEDEWEEPEWEDEDDEYVPSSTNGDYSPSDPYNAPGMKISDFI